MGIMGSWVDLGKGCVGVLFRVADISVQGVCDIAQMVRKRWVIALIGKEEGNCAYWWTRRVQVSPVQELGRYILLGTQSWNVRIMQTGHFQWDFNPTTDAVFGANLRLQR